MRKSNLRKQLVGGAAAGAIALALGAPAWAQEATYDFNQPSMEMAAAIQAVGHQTGANILVDSRLVSGLRSPELKGELSTDQALLALLDGTGLTMQRTDKNSILIRRASDPQSGSAAGDGADAGMVQALIVTAQKREENIQDVPIAMSAFTQEDLTRSQVAGGPDLMTQVPNMTFTKTNFSGYSIQIRGIGTQAISATTDPAVAVAFNNTPFVRNHFFEQEFYDLQRVEVLRGPQGTLYGRNATAGVVNVISAKANPSHFEAKLSGDISNYSSSRLEGMVNIPLVDDKAALRIAGAWTKRDGFVTNILTGEQTDGRDLWSGRVSLNLTPSDAFRADLIYEHFEEHDDRLRSGKQLCRKDPGPAEVGGKPVAQDGYALIVGANYFSQGCLPASLYSPDSFQTPNGYALAYYGAAGAIGSPVYISLDPYLNSAQSRNLREIETHIVPEYEASADVVELQLKFDISPELSLTSETGFSRDFIFSFEDFNRFDTTPGVFVPSDPNESFPKVHQDGTFCDPQLGCTNRLAAGDLATAQSQQFSQEFRLASDYEGAFNFSLGANFLRYDTEDKYYVFINSLTAFTATTPWIPGVTDNHQYFESNLSPGYVWSNPGQIYSTGVAYTDPNDIHNLNDEGRNYFLSRNPYGLRSYAVFGEAYYELSPHLKITAGLRWTVDQKTAPQLPSWLIAGNTYGTATRKTIRQEWREPTGRLAIDWKPQLSFTDETLLYGSYVHGYKAGGANPPPAISVFPPACPPSCGNGFEDAIVAESLAHPETFDAEFVNAFELGSKNTLLDGRLVANLSAFYYDYTGYQISQIVDRSASNLNFDATIWGLELQVDWRPLENLRLGLKGGYENTRLADGSAALDLMDRTAGNPDWILFKPLPPAPSNCIIPKWLAATVVGTYQSSLCMFYILGLDPFTNLPYVPNPTVKKDTQGNIVPITEGTYGADLTDYPGFDPSQANHGQGFLKDVSGNELPNAPDFTLTLTADYTVPLPSDWLMTLHTDLYYQSEAWTRIFNTEGYDKLKAYTNVNLAAIFTNENAGWNVMAYVKNVFDRDSITGAFLNSDDTGLTTNVFLTEPRLYGLRVTKMWNGSSWRPAPANRSGWYPFRIELNGDYGRFGHGHEILAPATAALFPKEHPYPLGIQNDLDWGSAGGVKLTYQPTSRSWIIGAEVRHGRATGGAESHPRWAVPGGLFYGPAVAAAFTAKFNWTPELAAWWLETFNFYRDPSKMGLYNYVTAEASSSESHTIADFSVGKDVGVGSGTQSSSTLTASLRYADFSSDSKVTLHGRPDLTFPAQDIAKYGADVHRLNADMDAHRSFEGAGIALDWEIKTSIVDLQDAGSVGLDAGVGAGVLWGRQAVKSHGQSVEDYIQGAGTYANSFWGTPGAQQATTTTSLETRRSEMATVPTANANLGLTYTLGGLKVSGGYRVERYFNVIDGGLQTRKTFDRQYDGPYFKVSVGFGG